MNNNNNNNSRIQLPPPFQKMPMDISQQMPMSQQHHVQFNNPNMGISSPNNQNISAPVDDSKFTKLGKNRVRVKKACDICKRQKSKCDGEFPCHTCSKGKKRCEYTQLPTPNHDHSASSTPAKDDSNHASISADSQSSMSYQTTTSNSYIKYLENKVRELQKYVSYNNFNSDEVEESFRKNMYTFSKDKYRVMRRYQNILPNELGETILNSLDESESEGLIVPRIQFYGWNMSGGHYLQQRKLPDMIEFVDFINEAEFINWLIEFYMNKINPLFSIIHEKVFKDQYNSYIRNINDTDTSKSTRLFSALVYLILAISLRYAENDPNTPAHIKEKIYSGLEEQLFESAYEVVDRLSFEWQSCELIQGWILITFFLRTTYRQNASYMSLGSAIRMCKGMSLNLNLVPETLDKPYEWLKSRQVFWIVYTFDRFYGFQSGKGYDIQDRTIITPFPELSVDSLDGWITRPALAMLYLSRISGEIQNFVNGNYRKDMKFIDRITQQLNNWEIWFHSNSQGFDSLLIHQVYLTYHDIVLNFNNKVLFKLLEREYYSDDSHKELSILVNHSGKILNIFKKIDSEGLLFVPWWLNLALLFHVALISVFLINSGLFQNISCQHLKDSIELLNKSSKHALMAKECVWVLKMLNHMCLSRMQKTIKNLNELGIDHAPGNEVNKVKYLQFGKVEDEKKNKKRKLNAVAPDFIQQAVSNDKFQDPVESFFQNDSNPDVFDLNNVDGLLRNLKWFEQWVDEFNQ